MGNRDSKSTSLINNIGAKPLDLLMFSSNGILGNIIGELEKLELGAGKWTHTGLVITSEIMPDVKSIKPGKMYVLESTLGLEVPDIKGENHRYGPQIRDVEAILQTEYKSGTVALFKLKNNPFRTAPTGSFDRTNKDIADIQSKFKDIYNDVSTKEYDIIGPIPGLFPSCRKEFNAIPIVNKYIEERFYCSELCAYVYKQFNIISQNVNPAYVVPEDFMGNDKDGMKIEFDGLPILIK